MEKGGWHPRNTAVDTGDASPGSRATVSFLSRRILDLASPLQGDPPQGGPTTMDDTPLTVERTTRPAHQPEAGRNVYCTNCLRTRWFHDRTTHLVCETCSKRLEIVAPPPRRFAG